MSTESSNTNAESSNIGRRSLTLLFLRRGEKEAARGADGVAGSLALPAIISSSVWHDEEEGSNERIKEEIKGKWMATNLSIRRRSNACRRRGHGKVHE